MISNTFAFICCVLFSATPASAQALRALQAACEEVSTVDNFDIEEYASKPWYSHQQAENVYSPIEQNFCVTAEYTIKTDPTFWGYTVSVNNQAQNQNGEKFGGELCAYQTDESLSKLAVAPCFVPKMWAGPYWVVAYDEKEGYALVSGGQPTQPGENGCTTGTGINNSGMYQFIYIIFCVIFVFHDAKISFPESYMCHAFYFVF